jgi:hypothetical protein
MKKIEGYVDGIVTTRRNDEIASVVVFSEDNGDPRNAPCVLIIGSPGEQAPRVFTEQEVVKMLREAYYINPETTDTYLSDLASRHSIELLTPTVE